MQIASSKIYYMFILTFIVILAIQKSFGLIPPVSKQETLLIKELATWTVSEYENNIFKDFNIPQIKKNLLSPFKKSSKKTNKKPTALTKYPNLPKSFDLRTHQASCVHKIAYQSQCASSWAFSVSHAMSDRFCIQGKLHASDLSPQYLISCDSENYGCNGGYISEAYFFSENEGLVNEKCFPYETNNENMLECPKKCTDNTELVKNRCEKNSVRDLSYEIEEMKNEIVKYGSISGSMILYQDFLYYSSGIYKHVYGSDLGRQGIRIVGFGQENDINYWVAANSWGEDWGEEGWFKIQFGEADIEGDFFNFFHICEKN